MAQVSTVFTGSGNWSDGARWSNGIPTSQKDAVIFAGANCTVSSNVLCNGLSVRTGASLNISSGNLNIASDFIISGTTSVSGSNDTITVDGSLSGNGNMSLGSAYLMLNGNPQYGGGFNSGTSTVCYNSNQNQDVFKGNYYTLTIRGSGNKTLTDTIGVNHLLNLQAASLSLNNKVLIINGTISATAGKIKGSTLSSVILAGGVEDILQLPMEQQPGNNLLGDLVINKTGGTVVMLSAPLGIAHSLKMEAGQLYTKAYLTLLADANGQGSIEAIPETAQITGTITAQQYIHAGNRRWIHVGVPVQGVTYEQLLDDIFVTATPSSLGFDHNATGKPSVFTYDEVVPGDEVTNGWMVPQLATQVIPGYKGVKLFFRGDRSDTTVLYIPQNTSSAIIDFTGRINSGTINIPVQFTNNEGNPEDDGWNFISNPYPCNIDWEAEGWTKKHLENTIWIWNPSCNSYGVWNMKDGTNGVNSIIPQGGGFWVKAKNANASLTISETVKTSKKPKKNFFKANNHDPYHIHIRLELDSVNHDETIIDFDEDGQPNYADSGDALKLKGGDIDLWTLSGDEKALAINMAPLPQSGDTMPLLFDMASGGLFTLRFNEVRLPANINALLVDHYTSKSYHVQDGYEVRLLINEEAASRSTERLELIFLPNTSDLILQEVKTNANCSAADLRWFTTYELHNRRYRIERSIIDSLHFATIDMMLPRDTHYLYPVAYSLSDPGTYKGKAFYRVVREFLDGMQQYSNILETDCTGATGEKEMQQRDFRVYPVPFGNSITISIPSGLMDTALQLRIFDLSGQTLVTQTIAVTSKNIQLNTSGLPSGCYFMELKSGNHFQVLKIPKL